jgi:predicted metal-binding membrane protein
MLLLFVGGVMNLVWLTALTLFVALEKLAPMGPAAGKALAGVLMAAGAALLALG